MTLISFADLFRKAFSSEINVQYSNIVQNYDIPHMSRNCLNSRSSSLDRNFFNTLVTFSWFCLLAFTVSSCVLELMVLEVWFLSLGAKEIQNDKFPSVFCRILNDD